MQVIYHRAGCVVLYHKVFQGVRCFSAVLLVSSALAGTAFAEDASKETPAKSEKPQASATAVSEALPKAAPEVKPGLAGSFLSGRFAKQNQDVKEAARYINETLARDPNNEALQQEAMRMHLLANNVADATALAHILAQQNASDPLIVSLLMLEALKADDFSKAKQVVQKGSGAGLFGLIRPVMLEWIDVASGSKKSVIDMRNAAEKSGFFAPFINYHTALMNDAIGNHAAAKTSYAKANTDAGVTPYRVIEAIANFEARQGRWDEAQAAFDAYAKANPQSTLIPEKLVPGSPPKPLVADGKQGLAELYFTTASILFGENATQDTFVYLRIALELQPNLPPAQLMLANLYEQLGDYKQAIAVYDSIAEGSVYTRRALVRKALNYEALGEKEMAIQLLDAQSVKYPKDATALITKADMQRDAKQFAEAVKTYGEAIARTEPLTGDDWPLLYARGISYERAGDWNKAEADFLRALKLQPDQPDVLNYLAYSWLTMGKNIAQARDYLDVALAQRPDDAHIIDSMGWAYYLSGDYKMAVEQFERAVELMPDDSTVNDHLGDAYWRIGREVEARYQWQRALTFKPEKEAADAIQTKLDKGLPEIGKPKPQVSAKSPVEEHVQ